MRLKKHLPSHLNISGNDALITYDAQPQTCYKCNEVGHQRQEYPKDKRLAASIHTQSNHIVSSRVQEHSPDVSAFQNPLPSDNKTKRQNTFIDETPDKKRMSTIHDLHNETDGRSKDTMDIENDHKGQNTSDIEDMQMTPSGYKEDCNSSKDDGCEKESVDKAGTERSICDNSKGPGENNNIVGTRAEGTRKENNQLKGKIDPDDTPPVQLGSTRTKKLKTEREDPATSMRNRRRTRIKKMSTKAVK